MVFPWFRVFVAKDIVVATMAYAVAPCRMLFGPGNRERSSEQERCHRGDAALRACGGRRRVARVHT
jgi:hypothetical protein